MAEILGDAIIKLKENTGFDIHVSDTKLRKKWFDNHRRRTFFGGC
jgi:hypothetical protein